MKEAISRYWALIEQARYLRCPSRRSGPAMGEAEEAAKAMEREAEELSETMFDNNNTP